jgi:hypothetical protein
LQEEESLEGFLFVPGKDKIRPDFFTLFFGKCFLEVIG